MNSLAYSESLCDAILDAVYEQLCEACSTFPSIDNAADWALAHTVLCAFCNWEVMYAEVGS